MASDDFLFGLLGALKAGEKGLDAYRREREYQDELTGRKNEAFQRNKSRLSEAQLRESNAQHDREKDVFEQRLKLGGGDPEAFGRGDPGAVSAYRSFADSLKRKPESRGPDDLAEIASLQRQLEAIPEDQLTGQQRLSLDAYRGFTRRRSRNSSPSESPRPADRITQGQPGKIPQGKRQAFVESLRQRLRGLSKNAP